MAGDKLPGLKTDAALSLVRVLLPILLALCAGAVLLAILGKDPLAYYGYVLKRGLYSPSASRPRSPARRRCC